MKYPAYPKYKESGVAWLGEVPEHWEVRRLKDVGRLTAGAGFPHEHQGIEDEEFPFYKVGDLRSSSDGRGMSRGHHSISREIASKLRANIIPPQSIIYAKIGAALLLNRRRITNAPCCIDNNMTAYIPNNQKVDTYFGFYWLSTLDFGEFTNPGAVPSFSEGYQSTLPIILPPPTEQTAIADFLDRETGRIDTLVAKKRQLLDRLKEKRTALISHTVTCGLPAEVAREFGLEPHTRFKNSGIEWLGEVPEGWEVVKVKYVAKMESGHTPSRSEPSNWIEDECVIPWVSLNDTKFLKENDFISDTAVKISEEGISNSSAHLLPAGVVVFTRDATIGLTAITTCPAAVSQHIIAWVPGARIFPKYLLLSFKVMQQYLESLTFGSTLKTIGMPDVRKLTTPVPSLPEQTAIATYLDRETTKLDRLTEKVETAIARLQEYRTALITAAVTGKIDVREEMCNE